MHTAELQGAHTLLVSAARPRRGHLGAKCSRTVDSLPNTSTSDLAGKKTGSGTGQLNSVLCHSSATARKSLQCPFPRSEIRSWVCHEGDGGYFVGWMKSERATPTQVAVSATSASHRQALASAACWGVWLRCRGCASSVYLIKVTFSGSQAREFGRNGYLKCPQCASSKDLQVQPTLWGRGVRFSTLGKGFSVVGCGTSTNLSKWSFCFCRPCMEKLQPCLCAGSLRQASSI